MRIFHTDSGADDEGQALPGDAVVSLTPYGRAMYERFIEQCSEIAGRPVTADDIIEIREQMRIESGEELDFCDPEVIQNFCKRLQQPE